MAYCRSIDPLVAPYVDGELSGADRLRVDEHLRRCPPCHSRVAAEGAIRALLKARKTELTSERASAGLRTRCRSLSRADADVSRRPAYVSGRAGAAGWLGRMPLALAAGLVMVTAAGVVYQATGRSALVMAAELAADHVKCFAENRLLGTHEEPADAQRAMLSSFGWHLHFSEQLTHAGFELVGARGCLYGEGRIAHVMYRQQGRPVSVFMLPKSIRREEMIDVLGHEAAIWSAGDRTFVLVTRGSRSDVEQAALVAKASFY